MLYVLNMNLKASTLGLLNVPHGYMCRVLIHEVQNFQPMRPRQLLFWVISNTVAPRSSYVLRVHG